VIPPAGTFRARRERLLERLGGGVAVFPAALPLHKSRDTEIRFRQDSDFHYLTGFGEPGAVAVLSPHDADHRFTLFVRPREPERERWDGPRAGVEGARERFGADAAYPIAELGARLRDLLEPAEEVVCPLGVDSALEGRLLELLAGFRRTRPRSGRGPLRLVDADAALAPLRMVKEPWEVERLRAAAELSAAGHHAALARARPGVGEWELEAVLAATFRGGGGAGAAFPSIVGSGPNATVLHHTANDRRTEAGELVLIDAGAELDMYCGDITRTFPVSGRWEERQLAVYDVVLAAQAAALAAVRPGAPIAALHDAALRVLVEGMLQLRLLRGDADGVIESGAYKSFYMHQTSHWLGLDVHDVGPYRTADGPTLLRPGMVLTLEPGLYVPADAEGAPVELRGIGVRIEDDVLVTSGGHEVLTRAVPVEPAALAALVGG
jgi:Xaa-Pro aminopeptidase